MAETEEGESTDDKKEELEDVWGKKANKKEKEKEKKGLGVRGGLYL